MEKIIVITGAGRGIGNAIAHSLNEDINKLVLITKTQESLSKLKRDFPNALSFACDITNDSELNKTIMEIKAKLKHVDVIVNNAGLSYFSRVFEKTEAVEFDKVFSMYLRAPFVIIKEMLPLLRKSKSPVVINIASAAAFAKFRTESIYSAVKSGLTAFTDVVREELQKDRIRFTTIQPYGVNTWNDPNPENLLRPQDIGELVKYIVTAHPNCQILTVSLSSTGQWRQGKQPWINE